MIKDENYAFMQTPSEINTEYQNCNFSQTGEFDAVNGWKPTRIFPGDDTPRKFVECLMINVIPPPGSRLIGCNTTISHKDITGDEAEETIEETIYGHVDKNTFLPVYLITPHVDTKHRVKSVMIEVRKSRATEVKAHMQAIGANPK